MTVRKTLPEIDTFQQLFELNEAEGVLVWRLRGDEFAAKYGWAKLAVSTWNTKFAGRPAGSPTKFGYLRVAIDDQRYLVHRIIWKMVHGNEPDHIDRVDGCRSNNKRSNLRDVSALQNQRNRKLNSNSSSGVAGVHWCKKKRLWISRIGVGGSVKVLGSFSERDDAVRVRAAAERELGYHENHGRKVAN